MNTKEEICQCGHKKSDHGSLVRHGVRIPAAGNCCATNCHCQCKRYRWACWSGERKKALAAGK